MKQLRKPSEHIGKIVGLQTLSDMKYVESPYIVKEGNAWFNTFSEEAVLIENLDRDRDKLIEHWFYIPESMDLKVISDYIRANMRTGSKWIQSFIIFTTTSCNASCSYCFEKDMPVQSIDANRAKDIVSFIKKKADPSKSVRIKWFGGEPLCNKTAMNDICRLLKEDGLQYTSTITTNGSLLNACSDLELKDIWNITKVQLTFDDIGFGYDNEKGLKCGSYETLKSSMKRLNDLGIHVTIRIHYHPEKGVDICRRIINEFKEYENVSMYVHLIYGNDSIDLYQDVLNLENYLISLGKMKVGFPGYSFRNNCMADSDNAACITPLGFLVPCEHFVTDEIYGSIFDDDSDSNIRNTWKKRFKNQNEKCKRCALYPCCIKLSKCPIDGRCSEGYIYYKTEQIKRALRKKVKTLGNQES